MAVNNEMSHASIDYARALKHNMNMNRMSNERRAQVIGALVEGSSIRSVVRMTGVNKKTVMRLLFEVGVACAEYQDKALRGLKCRRVQCDEIWSFCGAKDKNVPESKK